MLPLAQKRARPGNEEEIRVAHSFRSCFRYFLEADASTAGYELLKGGFRSAWKSSRVRSGRYDKSVAPSTAICLTAFATAFPATELSSRPERSAVEGPAVSLPVLTQTLRTGLTFGGRPSGPRIQNARLERGRRTPRVSHEERTPPHLPFDASPPNLKLLYVRRDGRTVRIWRVCLRKPLEQL